MLLWKPRTGLLITLAFLAATVIATDKKADVPKPGNNATLDARKMDVDRQGGAILGLATLLFPVLPMLLIAPLAFSSLGPALNFLSDTVNGAQGASGNSAASSSPIGDILNTLGGGSGGTLATLGNLAQLASGVSGNSEPAASSLSSITQALGLGSSSSSSSSGSGSLLSGLLGSSGSSGSSSLVNSLFGSEPSSGSSSLFGGSSGSSIFGNSASGSNPKPSIALPPGKQPNHTPTTADFIGAAAAALDNAGLLGSFGGSGSGSLASQILNVAGGGKPSAAASGALAEILSGLGSNLMSSSGSSSAPQFSNLNALSQLQALGQQSPQLGSGLSSNIIQGLPINHQMLQQGLANAGNIKPSSSLTSLLGLGSGSQSGSFQKLANNALNSITNFLFTKRRSEWVPPHHPEFLFDAASTKTKGAGMLGYLKDAFYTLKDGVRRYEIGESECQARLICELHQKSVGRSFKTWANTILDVLGVESYLERTSFGARTKSVMKDFYRAARNGMIEKDCALTYSKCPVAVAVEPIRNSVFNKIIGRPQNGQQQPAARPSIVYGPSKLNTNQQGSAQSKTAPVAVEVVPLPQSKQQPSQQANSQQQQPHQHSQQHQSPQPAYPQQQPQQQHQSPHHQSQKPSQSHQPQQPQQQQPQQQQQQAQQAPKVSSVLKPTPVHYHPTTVNRL